MADRKKNRRKLEEQDDKPTKEDYAVAKFLRFKVSTKEAKLHNMEVQCFFASAAVDALMESKWSVSKNAKEPLFSNRHSCVTFCQRLLDKGMFHRAEKVARKKDKGDKGETSKKKRSKEPSEKDKEEVATGEELRERKKKDRKGKKEKDDSASEKTAEGGSRKEDKKDEEKKDEVKKKKEKRLKLIMTDDQRFLDGEENIYVWIYDPVNAKTLLIGSLIVLGAIALCLFPLWPEIVRVGVYYVSLAAAGFVGFILSLVVIRLILFCMIWLITLGRHHFWLLPNLTEDVGFFESFRPLYKHETVSPESAKDKEASKGATKSGKKASEKTKGSSASTDKGNDKEASESEQDEFEMINKGDVEEGAGEGEGQEPEPEPGQDTEDNGEAGEGEEEDEEPNEVEEDAEEEEEEEEDHYGEEEELEEEPQNEDEEAENKKDK